MPLMTLTARTRAVWEGLAGVQVAFAPVVRVVVSSRSCLCPPTAVVTRFVSHIGTRPSCQSMSSGDRRCHPRLRTLGQRAGQRVKQETAGPEVIRCGPDEPAGDELQCGGRGGPAVDVQSHAQRRVQRSRASRTWIRRVPRSRSCPIGPDNWLPPNRSSPPCPVRSQLSSAATHVSKGTSTIRQNDSDPSAGTMFVLMPSAPPSLEGHGSSLAPGNLVWLSTPSRLAVRPLPPHRTNALSSSPQMA